MRVGGANAAACSVGGRLEVDVHLKVAGSRKAVACGQDQVARDQRAAAEVDFAKSTAQREAHASIA